jgi:hypothetical protein
VAKVVGADEQRDEQLRFACLDGARWWPLEEAGSMLESATFGGASERLQGCAAGLEQLQLCAGTQRATVRKQEGAASRDRPALPLLGRRFWPRWRAMALLTSPWATLQSTCWVWSPEIASTSGVGGQWRASVSLRTAGTPSARGVGLPYPVPSQASVMESPMRTRRLLLPLS